MDVTWNKTVKRNQLEWLRSNTTGWGYLPYQLVQDIVHQNLTCQWNQSRLLLSRIMKQLEKVPSWPLFDFAHVPLNPGFCFVTALEWLDFFPTFQVCFDVTIARSLVDSLYGRLEGVLVRACSACGAWNWWIQMKLQKNSSKLRNISKLFYLVMLWGNWNLMEELK